VCETGEGEGGLSLETAQHEFVDLFVTDVEEHPSAYKEMIRAQPGLWALRIVAQLDEAEVLAMTRNLKAERARVTPPTGRNR